MRWPSDGPWPGRRLVRPGRPLLPALVWFAVLLVAGCSAGTTPATPLPTVAATAQVRTLCLTVVPSFTDLEGEQPQLPIEETVRTILEHLDLEVVTGAEICDARLEISLSFLPLGEQYSQVPMGGGRTCYAGAEATGEATLALPAGETLMRPLEMRSEPPFSVTECPGAAEAPFDSVWRKPVLEMLGEWWGLPALVAAMDADDPLTVGTAGGVMAAMGEDASPAVPFLMEMLAGGDDDGDGGEDGEGDFTTAAHVIVQISPEAAAQAMPLLVAALEQGERATRLAVIRGLGNTASPVPAATIDALVLALSSDEDPYLRAEAARMLGEIGADAAPAVPALTAALADPGTVMGSDIDTVGEAAAVALGAIGDPGAVSVLIADLESGDRAAGAAIDALATMGPAAAAAVPALIEMLDGEQWASASLALEAITGQYDYGEGEVYRRWWRSLECATAASATEGTVGGPGGELQVVVDEAGPIPDSFEDIRPCGPLSFGCQTRPDVVAEGQFFAAHYSLANHTDGTVELPAGCTHAVPRQQCPGWCWWITDGRTSWPATGSDVWEPWAVSQGSGTARMVDSGQTALSWA
ncbi:MAG TPA: HEAT repeat domain-containing protein, partial [Acidimicrobiia bacterium]|nr:HEAT repeat domain-containing protein [Acidimicrobiia bacterium]